MDLFEYQARDLFESHQIPVLAGAVATTADQAYSAAEKIGGKVVVKAQVKVGGRGKAGGVKLAENAADAKEKAGAILGMDIKGHIVKKVMIAQAAPIESEYYLAILLDRANRNFLVMASVAGGMEIEEVAHKTPEKLARVGIDPNKGIDKAQALEIAKGGQFPADVLDQVGDVLVKLWQAFIKEDATLMEINPLVKTTDGKVIALDGKVTLDDNAIFRHPEHEALVDHDATNPLEKLAKEKDLNYPENASVDLAIIEELVSHTPTVNELVGKVQQAYSNQRIYYEKLKRWIETVYPEMLGSKSLIYIENIVKNNYDT